MSSNGAVSQTGLGNMVLTTTNHYLGDSLISAGILQLGNGGNTDSITSVR
ncbi:MAG: hypothetical protein ACR5K7_01890 [Symbiopectobacterium sp.]